MESGKKVGSYVIEEPVGRGGMGVVYRGRHEKLHRVVAVKSINPRGTHDLRRLRHRFEREAFVQAQLDHPGIVKVYDYVVSEQTYYIVMEYVDGRSLAQVITDAGGALPVERALDLFEQILEAVAYAHTFAYKDESGRIHHGLVHRDLKPPNIMVTPADRIKVTDFGIVKLVGAAPTDTSNVAYGSPRYVSPEQAAGETLDQRSDIYSLGVMLYEMLTGEPPFGGRYDSKDAKSRTQILVAHRSEQPRPPSELNPEVPPEVEKIVLRALEKKAERRFHTAADFLRALRRARGREVPAAAEVQGAAEAGAGGGTTGVLGETTDELAGESYHTQPIVSEVCTWCGAEVGPEDTECPSCGRALSVSPATGRLAQQEATAKQGRHGLKLAAVSAALFVLLASLVFFVRQIIDEPRAGREGGETPAATPAVPSPSPQPSASPTQPSAPVAKLAARVSVDSTYDSYNTKPLTDGVIDVRQIASMRYNQGNWASAERPEPHWVELSFGRPARVSALYVYWGFDRGRYMPSRLAELQAPDGAGGWRTVSRLEPGGNFDRTAFDFEPFVADRLRVVQPAQQGPSNRPFVMWVREVEAFGSAPAEPKQ
jgi:tRNA A-37 threonylcarbamoyl transferase component Bud32